MDVDENGWATGAIPPLAIGEAWLLLSPDPASRIDAARWAHQASTFFRATLSPVQPKHYPTGALPLADRIELDIAPQSGGSATRVLVVTTPLDRAPAARKAAEIAVKAIGGAGFDALLARARRLWQVHDHVAPGGDPRAPLVATAVLASLFLAPVVPPTGGAIFGVKGARERLAIAGWKS